MGLRSCFTCRESRALINLFSHELTFSSRLRSPPSGATFIKHDEKNDSPGIPRMRASIADWEIPKVRFARLVDSVGEENYQEQFSRYRSDDAKAKRIKGHRRRAEAEFV